VSHLLRAPTPALYAAKTAGRDRFTGASPAPTPRRAPRQAYDAPPELNANLRLPSLH